jgi:hypothetical protein
LVIYDIAIGFVEQDMKGEELKKKGTTIFHIQTNKPAVSVDHSA